MQAQTITFIGLTRASLSVALAVKAGLPDLVRVGHDPTNPNLGLKAVERGIFARDERTVEAALQSADILILDLDSAATENLFPLIGKLTQEHAVITHLSPKAQAIQALADKHLPEGFFVNAAPVQSVHTFDSGDSDVLNSANADLFRDSLFCLMPSPKVDSGAVDTVRALGGVMGGKPFFIDTSEYDTYTTALDLLPKISQLALFEALHSQTAWTDMRRLAGQRFANSTAEFSDQAEGMANAIFADKNATLHWINQHIAALSDIKRWIETTDEEAVGQLISERSFDRDIWLQTRKDNQWEEGLPAEVETQNLKDMFVGGLFNRRRRG